MKNLFSVLVLCMMAAVLPAQEGAWVNRIMYGPTEKCVDSVQCFTHVTMDVNKSAVPDSAVMWMKIGTVFGADDIYSKKYRNVPSVYTLPAVTNKGDSIISVSLGDFIIQGPFFVDMEIKQPGGK